MQQRTYGHWISGNEVPGLGDLIDRVCPADGRVVAQFANGSASDVNQAVMAARAAFESGQWSRIAASKRAEVLQAVAKEIRDNSEMLARIETEESGKPIGISRDDIAGTAAHFDYAASLSYEVHGDSYTNLGDDLVGIVVREPVGVAGLIIPWNFPANTFAQKAAYALGAGCAVVVKPSEFTSGTALEIARLATAAGVPAGILNVVTGYGPVAGQALVEHPEVDFVSFTGSTATGRVVAAAAAKHHTRVALELGGKGASIVFADADLDAALEGVLYGEFFNTGETCASCSRLLVQEEVADEFISRVVQRVGQLRVGNPLDDTFQLGALIHQDHVGRVLGYIESGIAEGAKLLVGGKRLGEEGAYIEPTVFDDVAPGMRIFQEEIFGPVLCVVRFKDANEAVALANGTTYGLASSVWTRDINTAIQLVRSLRSGNVFINTTLDNAKQTPFGGVKGSGYGRELGRAGIEEFTELRTCVIRTNQYVGFGS